MKSASASPSATITFIMASASAVSLPGRRTKASSAWAQASDWRTSMATMRAPRFFAAATWRAVLGWLARLAPQRMTRAELADMSSLVLTSKAPVRPRPKAPMPQQIICPVQNCEPQRCAKRAINCPPAETP